MKSEFIDLPRYVETAEGGKKFVVFTFFIIAILVTVWGFILSLTTGSDDGIESRTLSNLVLYHHTNNLDTIKKIMSWLVNDEKIYLAKEL